MIYHWFRGAIISVNSGYFGDGYNCGIFTVIFRHPQGSSDPNLDSQYIIILVLEV